MSIRAGIVRFILRRTVKRQLAEFDDVVALRQRFSEAGRFTPAIPGSVAVVPMTVNGVPCESITVAHSDSTRVLLYLHGGGYVLGGPESHRDLAWRLADASGMRVLLVDYRLAPESPFPAAVEDATACYRWLIDEGLAPERLAIGGDSAGGGLAVAMLVQARNLGLPMPAGCILLSPWTDLTLSGDSVTTNDGADSMISQVSLAKFADLYVGKRDKRAPLASPLFADLAGLPPMLIQVGSTEVLLSDSQRLAQKVRDTGGEAIVDVWDNMPHVFALLAARIPEGKAAVVKLGEFLTNRTSGTSEPIDPGSPASS
jgi:epsilon-lactone hydrolase